MECYLYLDDIVREPVSARELTFVDRFRSLCPLLVPTATISASHIKKIPSVFFVRIVRFGKKLQDLTKSTFSMH